MVELTAETQRTQRVGHASFVGMTTREPSALSASPRLIKKKMSHRSRTSLY
jgi:hypothetical protein